MSNRTKAVVGLSLIFLLGGVCGALVYGIIIRDEVRERQQLKTHEGFLQYFEHRLHLTEAQRDSLRGELDRVYNQLAELRTATSAQYEAVIDTFTQRIAPRLTEDQRRLLREQELKFRSFVPHERRPRMGDGPPPAPPMKEGPPPIPRPVEPRRQESLAVATRRGNTSTGGTSAPPQEGTATNGTQNEPREDAALARLQERLQEARARLGLNDDQMTQIRAIFDDNRAKNAKVRSEFSTQPDLLQATVIQNNRGAMRRIRGLLTETQLAKLKEWRLQARAERQGRKN